MYCMKIFIGILIVSIQWSAVVKSNHVVFESKQYISNAFDKLKIDENYKRS